MNILPILSHFLSSLNVVIFQIQILASFSQVYLPELSIAVFLKQQLVAVDMKLDHHLCRFKTNTAKMLQIKQSFILHVVTQTIQTH